jgi:hypothetical protein
LRNESEQDPCDLHARHFGPPLAQFCGVHQIRSHGPNSTS